MAYSRSGFKIVEELSKQTVLKQRSRSLSNDGILCKESLNLTKCGPSTIPAALSWNNLSQRLKDPLGMKPRWVTASISTDSVTSQLRQESIRDKLAHPQHHRSSTLAQMTQVTSEYSKAVPRGQSFFDYYKARCKINIFDSPMQREKNFGSGRRTYVNETPSLLADLFQNKSATSKVSNYMLKKGSLEDNHPVSINYQAHREQLFKENANLCERELKKLDCNLNERAPKTSKTYNLLSKLSQKEAVVEDTHSKFQMKRQNKPRKMLSEEQ